MSDQRKLVLWCPHHPDRLVVGSNNLRLYQAIRTTPNQTTNTNTNASIGSHHSIDSSTNQASVSLPVAPSFPSSSFVNAPVIVRSVAVASSLEESTNTTNTTTTLNNSASMASAGVQVSTYFRLMDTVTYPQQSVNCISWGLEKADPLLLGAGLLSGRLALLRFLDEQKVIKEFVPRYARTCHAIAWNALNPALIAVGLDRVRNGYGTLVWDVNQRGAQQQPNAAPNNNAAAPTASSSHSSNTFSIQATRAPEVVVEMESTARVSNSEASVALSWFPSDAFCLAVGTGFKWLRTYDIRNPQRPMLSAMAHSKSVFGVKFDPSSSHRLATFSEDGVVKVWDTRSLRAPVLSMLTSGPSRARNDRDRDAFKPKALIDLEFCPTTNGMLATISKEEEFVRVWDISGLIPSVAADDPNNSSTNQSNIEPTLTESIPCRKQPSAGGAVSSLSWHPHVKQRLLTVTANGVLEDISLHDDMPLCFSPMNSLTFGCDDHLFIGDEIAQQPEFSCMLHDMATIMRVRAELGYSLDISLNHRIANTLQQWDLHRLWTWMAHCETLRGEGSSATNNIPNPRFSGLFSVLLPSLSLKALRPSSANSRPTPPPTPVRSAEKAELKDDNDHHSLLNALSPSSLVDTSHCVPRGFKVYTSNARSEALKICGWWDTFASSTNNSRTNTAAPANAALRRAELSNASTEHINLENALRNLEEKGEYERAAAIAAFHLDLKRALLSLSKGAEKYRASGGGTKSTVDLDLIAMALSGYASLQRPDSPESVNNGLWGGTWLSTLQHKTISHHLKALFSFLSTNGPSNPTIAIYRSVLEDSGLDLRDRLAFACRFLPDDQLCDYIERCTINALDQGDLDGLLLTGLGVDGIELLASYCDRTSDIQTTAILAAFSHAAITSANENAESDPRIHMWILTYKELLNQWRLWTIRAKFDVARSLLSIGSASTTVNTNLSTAAQAERAATLKNKKLSSLNIKPQVYARCNFCSQALSLEGLTTQKGQNRNPAANFRSRLATPTRMPDSATRTSGCPSCKKSLPRCALCLIPLDLSLPTIQSSQLSHSRIKRRTDNNESVTDDASRSRSLEEEDSRFDSTSMQEFGKWWSWCQNCRHGGHADHIIHWFRTHSECPVTDCSCRCMSLDLAVPSIST